MARLPWLDALHGNHDVLLRDGGDKLTLDREVVLGLVDACDAYVSLHRAEGFGRTLAEAMLLGKPVVGTDFSGNTDFLTQDTGYPVKWTRRAVALGGTHSSSPTTKPGGPTPTSPTPPAKCAQPAPQPAAPGPCNCRNK